MKKSIFVIVLAMIPGVVTADVPDRREDADMVSLVAIGLASPIAFGAQGGSCPFWRAPAASF